MSNIETIEIEIQSDIYDKLLPIANERKINIEKLIEILLIEYVQKAKEEVIEIIKLKQTYGACPSQWDAWDAEDNYYYVRYRHGLLTVHKNRKESAIYHKRIGDHMDGCMNWEEIEQYSPLRFISK